MLKTNKTIFALSTFYGQSAIAVTRLSGPGCYEIAKSISGLKQLKARYCYFCKLKDKNGDVYDEGLIIYFKSPHSFTGEDVLEIQTHGGIAIINKLMKELAKFPNVHPAEAGEFSKRSFFNNKRDIFYYEGINNLIKAESESQLRIANKQAFNKKKNPCSSWKEKLIELKAYLNAKIEFGDDLSDMNLDKFSNKMISDVKADLYESIEKFKFVNKIFHGHKILVIGPPNTGKSSVINFLFQDEKSITSRFEGTTTDQIEYNLLLEKEKVILIDSAGVRDSRNLIEKKGIKKTLNSVEEISNFILVISPESSKKKTIQDLNDLLGKMVDKNIAIIFNKTDIKNSQIEFEKIKERMNLKTRYKIFRLSCKNDNNNSKVLKRLQKFITKNLIKSEHVYENELFFSEIRQQERLKRVYSCLESCEESLGELEIATDFVLQAIGELDNVLGKHDNDQELGIIFKNFCIGK